MDHATINTIITAIGFIAVAFIGRKNGKRASHAVEQNVQILHELGTVRIEIDGNLKRMEEVIRNAAFARGVKHEQDAEKRRSQMIDLPADPSKTPQ